MVDTSWRRGFTRLGVVSCVFGVIFPFLVWTPAVKFQPGLGDDGGDLNPFQKLFVFYRAPIIKYTGSAISFFALLALYTYVAVFGFRFDYQWPEIALYIWFGILILDEFREVLYIRIFMKRQGHN